MRTKITAAFILIFSCMCFLSSCAKNDPASPAASGSTAATGGIDDYLGDYDYESSLAALVYEPVQGEDEYGIQWRSVKDLDGILSSGRTVLLYFYNSLSTDRYGITAGLEDIAQACWGEMLVIMIDTLEHGDIEARYGIERLPEFIIIKDHKEAARFEGFNYEVWTMDNVAKWIADNGIKLDYSRLELPGEG